MTHIKPFTDTRPVTGKQPVEVLALLLRERLLQPHIGDEDNFHAADRDMRHLTSSCVALAEHHPSRTFRAFKWTAPSHPPSQLNYQAGLLAHQLAPHLVDAGPFVDKLLTAATDVHMFDIRPKFFEDCRDLLWELDVFLKGESRPERAVMDDEHRASVLHGLFLATKRNTGASYEMTYLKSIQLLDVLQYRNISTMVGQLRTDLVIIGTTAATTAGAASSTVVVTTTLAKATVAPFKANTVLSLAKAASLAVGALSAAMLGSAAVVVSVIVGKNAFAKHGDERTVAYTGLLGKDLLYLEWMTGRHKKKYQIFESLDLLSRRTRLGRAA